MLIPEKIKSLKREFVNGEKREEFYSVMMQIVMNREIEEEEEEDVIHFER